MASRRFALINQAIQDDQLSDNVALLDADNEFTGDNTFTSEVTFTQPGTSATPISSILLESTLPTINWRETDQGTDEKNWWVYSSAGIFTLGTSPDAGGSVTPALRIGRSGTTITEIELNATLLDINGEADVSGNMTALRIRATSTGDASLVSTTHGFQVGPDSGDNIIIDTNEIIARDNGGTGILNLQTNGGILQVGITNALSEVDINATLIDIHGAAEFSSTIDAVGAIRTEGSLIAAFGSTQPIEIEAGNDGYNQTFGAAGAMDFNCKVPNGDNASARFGRTVNTSGLNSLVLMRGNNSTAGSIRLVAYGTTKAGGSIYIQEMAAAGANTAGQGQLWVKNTVPCELWFTDDAGNDTQIV